MSFLIRGTSYILGTVLPCVYSFKALKKPRKPELMHLVQYWTVYGAMCFVDWILETFFLKLFIPFYDVFFLAALIFITVPQFGGAGFVYKKILAPAIRRKERDFDRIMVTGLSYAIRHGPTLMMQGYTTIQTVISSSSQNLAIECQSDSSDGEQEDTRVLIYSPRKAQRQLMYHQQQNDNVEYEDDVDEGAERDLDAGDIKVVYTAPGSIVRRSQRLTRNSSARYV